MRKCEWKATREQKKRHHLLSRTHTRFSSMCMFSRVLKMGKREFMCEYMLKAATKKKCVWKKYIWWRQRQQIFIRKAPFKCSDIHEAISSLSNRVYLISTAAAATTTKNKNDNEETAKRTNGWICVHLNKWHLWIKIYCVWSKHKHIMLFLNN